MIGGWYPSRPSCSCSSRPLRPGKRISTIRQPGAAGSSRVRYSFAEAKVSQFSPTDATSRFSADRTDGSSSMTKTVAASRMGSGGNWNPETECSTTPGIRGRPQNAAVCFDDRPADCETDPGALWLGCEKRLEDMLNVASWQANARVSHAQDRVGAPEAGADAQNASTIIHILHGIDPVLHEIERDLLNQDFVGVHERQRRIEAQLETHAASEQPLLRDAEHLTDDVIQIEEPAVRRTVREQLARSLDDLAGAVAFVHDVVQRRAHLAGAVGNFEPVAARVRIGHDRAQGLIDFMRDRDRQLPERHQPGDLRELVLSLLQCAFCFLAASDVGGGSGDTDDSFGHPLGDFSPGEKDRKSVV